MTEPGVVPPEALLGPLAALLGPLPPLHALRSIREVKIRHNDNDEVFTLVSTRRINGSFAKVCAEEFATLCGF